MRYKSETDINCIDTITAAPGLIFPWFIAIYQKIAMHLGINATLSWGGGRRRHWEWAGEGGSIRVRVRENTATATKS